MLFTVTRKHIRSGEIANCETCPVALSALDLFPGAMDVCANSDYITIISSYRQRHTFSTPSEAKEFMSRFDRKELVRPIKFEAQLIYQGPMHDLEHLGS